MRQSTIMTRLLLAATFAGGLAGGAWAATPAPVPASPSPGLTNPGGTTPQAPADRMAPPMGGNTNGGASTIRPAPVDPGIQATMPRASGTSRTPVIKPPGAAGTNSNVVPK